MNNKLPFRLFEISYNTTLDIKNTQTLCFTVRGGPPEENVYIPEVHGGTSTTEKKYFDVTTTPSYFPYTENNEVTVSYGADVEIVDVNKERDTTQDTPVIHSPSFPDICQGNIDAAAMLRQELFIFKDEVRKPINKI